LVTRELGPPESAEDPLMKGDDVAMLESLLWHLGLSPQNHGAPNDAGVRPPNSGSEGARIHSARSSGGNINTLTCDGHPTKASRDIFYTGYVDCPASRVSMELMVRRFQARNNSVVDRGTPGFVSRRLIRDQSGRTGEETLAWLNRDWTNYTSVFPEFGGNQHILPSEEEDQANFSQWAHDALDIWDEGLAGHLDIVPANIYTEAEHNAILQIAGINAPTEAQNRESLLAHWIEEEAKAHWGKLATGYQPTAYRMFEGGADEHASLSFSQLLYGMRYSQWPCAAHYEAGLNLYHPADQMKTFIIHTASTGVDPAIDADTGIDPQSCPGGFYVALNIDNSIYRQTFNMDNANLYAIAGANVDDLVGYRHGAGVITRVVENADAEHEVTEEDDYEMLTKAIMIYNGLRGILDDHSYAKLLKYMGYDPFSKENTAEICHTCKYVIRIKQSFMPGHLRTYIWEGGTVPLQIPDPDYRGEGEAPMINNQDPNAGQEWCFAYGEEEWLNPGNNPLTGTILDFNGYRDLAIADTDRRVDCE
ncbi:MAG: hypothetical protein P8X79_22490, partial [Reinekea sp.]